MKRNTQKRPHRTEDHKILRVGWLRAAVLGANDGIVSTGSLILGVAAACVSHSSLLLTGVAGLVAGAMSMAAGEYVSVHAQADTERADLALEGAELKSNPEAERRELTAIYVKLGVSPALAQRVAQELMAHDALGAHARDELGISEVSTARPIQAALTSAASFTLGAAMPLGIAALVPTATLIPWVASTSLCALFLLGALSAHAGGVNPLKGAARVTLCGVLAMVFTAAIGKLFGALI